MAGTITTDSVADAVSQYLAVHHPLAECLEVSVLELDETWLVQATVEGIDGSEPAERLVLLVKDGGVVDEVGSIASRQSAQRCLAGLKRTAHAEAQK